MRSLVETIDRTLMSIGREPRDLLFETIMAFDNLGLSKEEEICAVASAVACNAVGTHRRHIARYLDAIKVWAIEMAIDAAPPPPRVDRAPVPESVADGADLLIAGTRELLEALEAAEVLLQDRLVAELTLFARLLQRYDVNTINLALYRIGEATGSSDFKPGELIAVPLREARILTRADRLDEMVMRGTA